MLIKHIEIVELGGNLKRLPKEHCWTLLLLTCLTKVTFSTLDPHHLNRAGQIREVSILLGMPWKETTTMPKTIADPWTKFTCSSIRSFIFNFPFLLYQKIISYLFNIYMLKDCYTLLFMFMSYSRDICACAGILFDNW